MIFRLSVLWWNRSLQESGVRYFTEENEAGNKKLSEKIKGIFKAVWDGIVGIFNKIKEFFSDLIVNFRVKAADPKNKEIVKNATDDDINKIVKDKVSIYYDIYINTELVVISWMKDRLMIRFMMGMIITLLIQTLLSWKETISISQKTICSIPHLEGSGSIINIYRISSRMWKRNLRLLRIRPSLLH